jgi:hypothetical protein
METAEDILSYIEAYNNSDGSLTNTTVDAFVKKFRQTFIRPVWDPKEEKDACGIVLMSKTGDVDKDFFTIVDITHKDDTISVALRHSLKSTIFDGELYTPTAKDTKPNTEQIISSFGEFIVYTYRRGGEVIDDDKRKTRWKNFIERAYSAYMHNNDIKKVTIGSDVTFGALLRMSTLEERYNMSSVMSTRITVKISETVAQNLYTLGMIPPDASDGFPITKQRSKGWFETALISVITKANLDIVSEEGSSGYDDPLLKTTDENGFVYPAKLGGEEGQASFGMRLAVCPIFFNHNIPFGGTEPMSVFLISDSDSEQKREILAKIKEYLDNTEHRSISGLVSGIEHRVGGPKFSVLAGEKHYGSMQRMSVDYGNPVISGTLLAQKYPLWSIYPDKAEYESFTSEMPKAMPTGTPEDISRYYKEDILKFAGTLGEDIFINAMSRKEVSPTMTFPSPSTVEIKEEEEKKEKEEDEEKEEGKGETLDIITASGREGLEYKLGEFQRYVVQRLNDIDGKLIRNSNPVSVALFEVTALKLNFDNPGNRDNPSEKIYGPVFEEMSKISKYEGGLSEAEKAFKEIMAEIDKYTEGEKAKAFTDAGIDVRGSLKDELEHIGSISKEIKEYKGDLDSLKGILSDLEGRFLAIVKGYNDTFRGYLKDLKEYMKNMKDKKAVSGDVGDDTSKKIKAVEVYSSAISALLQHLKVINDKVEEFERVFPSAKGGNAPEYIDKGTRTTDIQDQFTAYFTLKSELKDTAG